MQALRIIAGKKAQQVIRDHGGLTPEMIRVVVGASGGPKWLVLRGLDDFVFGDWLLDSPVPKDLIGTSIGSMRMSLAATKDPRQAFNDCVERYMSFRYEKSGNPDIWTADMVDFYNQILHPDRREAILTNADRKLNIIATRCRGIAGHPTSLPLNILGMMKAYAKNALSSSSLESHFDRVIFSVPSANLPIDGLQDLNMQQAKINADNMIPTLMASGSIPGVWHGIKDIAGAPKGLYRDGGITDYHFANKWVMPDTDADKLVLYPHFYSHITPRWFDKKIKSRRMSGENWDNVVMLCPSDDLVASLPNGRITDRTDFTEYSNDERVKVWQSVIDSGYKMADEFANFANDGSRLIDHMELPA